MSSTNLTHLDSNGQARMVNVGEKPITRREAVAVGTVKTGQEFLAAVQKGNIPKGDVFATARIAGIMAAKRTDELIPLCHCLELDGIRIDFRMEQDGVAIEAAVTRERIRDWVLKEERSR
jgi:cyclic pyranopterin phosphate synthase